LAAPSAGASSMVRCCALIADLRINPVFLVS
jgi:hypothetical protein